MSAIIRQASDNKNKSAIGFKQIGNAGGGFNSGYRLIESRCTSTRLSLPSGYKERVLKINFIYEI